MKMNKIKKEILNTLHEWRKNSMWVRTYHNSDDWDIPLNSHRFEILEEMLKNTVINLVVRDEWDKEKLEKENKELRQRLQKLNSEEMKIMLGDLRAPLEQLKEQTKKNQELIKANLDLHAQLQKAEYEASVRKVPESESNDMFVAVINHLKRENKILKSVDLGHTNKQQAEYIHTLNIKIEKLEENLKWAEELNERNCSEANIKIQELEQKLKVARDAISRWLGGSVSNVEEGD